MDRRAASRNGRAAPAPPTLAHLLVLSDDVGIIQHARYNVPNRWTGYCTDDVARAFIAAVAAEAQGVEPPTAHRLAGRYLAFLNDAQLPGGRFHNFMGYDRVWLDSAGGGDAFGRAVWALGYGATHAGDPSWRRLCRSLLEGAMPAAETATFLRSWALIALGVAHAADGEETGDPALVPVLERAGEQLAKAYAASSTPGWDWFEPELTYDNARLCEAILRAGLLLDRGDWIEIGLRTLDFYAGVVIEDGIFVPIGSNGWYRRGGPRARFPQQPLEAAAAIDAALCAANLAADPERYLGFARCAFDWFYGANSAGAVLVRDGGCCDGIEPFGVNENMGAESTLAYLSAALAMSERRAAAKSQH